MAAVLECDSIQFELFNMIHIMNEDNLPFLLRKPIKSSTFVISVHECIGNSTGAATVRLLRNYPCPLLRFGTSSPINQRSSGSSTFKMHHASEYQDDISLQPLEDCKRRDLTLTLQPQRNSLLSGPARSH
jgi:hypothetical protein